MTPALMLVRWKDAVHFDEERDTADLTPRSIARQTVGFCLADDDEGVLLAFDQSESGKQWTGVMSIPAGMILEKTLLARVEPEPEVVATWRRDRANANDAHRIYDGQ